MFANIVISIMIYTDWPRYDWFDKSIMIRIWLAWQFYNNRSELWWFKMAWPIDPWMISWSVYDWFDSEPIPNPSTIQRLNHWAAIWQKKGFLFGEFHVINGKKKTLEGVSAVTPHHFFWLVLFLAKKKESLPKICNFIQG